MSRWRCDSCGQCYADYPDDGCACSGGSFSIEPEEERQEGDAGTDLDEGERPGPTPDRNRDGPRTVDYVLLLPSARVVLPPAEGAESQEVRIGRGVRPGDGVAWELLQAVRRHVGDNSVLTMSRDHAELRITRSGVAVVDLASTNGTFVNGERLEPRSRRRLSPHDKIAFGEVTLTFDMVDR